MTTISNSLKLGFDKPIWEWTRFAQATSSSLTASCIADNNKFRQDNTRYIYYAIANNIIQKYDVWTDTWVAIASAGNTTFVTSTSMKYSDTSGFENRVISATSTTITAGVPGKVGIGAEIRIIQGTGKGQRRIITDIADPVIADFGTVSSAGGAGNINDTVKNWAFNTWVGYTLRLNSGTTTTASIRKILSNTATVITTQDLTQYAYDDECNSPNISTQTAGSATGYVIESSVVTVDTAWDVTPDATSRFVICTGGIYLHTGNSSTPFLALLYYDNASDLWYINHSMSSIHTVSQTEPKMLRLGENACLWEYGKATSGSATTLVDTSKGWTTNQWVGNNVFVFSGTGRGTIRAISANTGNTLTIASGTALDSTSRYCIEGFDSGKATSGSTTTLVDSTKSWTTNRWKNYAVSIVAGSGVGLTGLVASNTGTTMTFTKALATAIDSTSVYIIRGDSDRIYLSNTIAGTTSATMTYIHDTESNMQLSSKPLDFGVARGGSAQYGEYPARAISTGTVSGNVVTITTAQNHDFKTGMSITHRGDTGASAGFNNITATITVTGATTYTYPAPSSVNNWTITAQSTTTLVDASKNWTTNQWAGFLVTYPTSQGNPSSTANTWLIASNTATTLTLVSATTAPTVGISKYAIHPVAAIGSDDSGTANGTHSGSTLQDTTKSWAVNVWAGKRLRIVSGPGVYNETTVTSNTSNTLTLSTIITTPVTAQTAYSLYHIKERATGHCIEWNYGETNLANRGRYIYSQRGGTPGCWDRYDITTDRWTTLVASPFSESLSVGAQYAYDGQNRIYFQKESTNRFHYLDLTTHQIHGAGNSPYLPPSGTIGNRMEIFKNPDDTRFMWVNRGGNSECYIHLLFY